MSSRLAYPYLKVVHKARYPKGDNVPTFDKYNDGGCPREPALLSSLRMSFEAVLLHLEELFSITEEH